MREYVIMTDSCCDLTDHMARELGLTVVPLTVHIDGHDYPNMLDGSAISFEDFYGKIRSGVLATTSAANVGQFQEVMRPILAEGKDIVSINFSSALSTTYQSACIAAQDMKEEFPDANIYVVDSLSASLGQGLLLYLAAHKKQEGLSAQELVQWVEDNKLHNVRLLGRLPNDRVRSLMATSRALILPTQCYEGFPLCIAEAYSVGTPVLVSKLGNGGSLVRSGVTGLKFDQQSPQSIAKTVKKFMNTEDVDWQANTSAYYRENLTPEMNYARLMEVYRAAKESI